jgi:hypothetical protein
MPRKLFRYTTEATPRRRSSPPLRDVQGHAGAGLALAAVFTGVLCGSGSTIGRLVLTSDNLPLLVALFLMHAALFGCASFATSTVADPPGPRPAGKRSSRPEWALRAAAAGE